jgi:pyruvate kinase
VDTADIRSQRQAAKLERILHELTAIRSEMLADTVRSGESICSDDGKIGGVIEKVESDWRK